MTLWSIQPLNLYEKLLTQGIIHCDPKSSDFWGFSCKEFIKAYDWIVQQMKVKISSPPKGVKYPFWELHVDQIKNIRKFVGRRPYKY